MVKVQFVGDPLAAGGAVELGLPRPVGEAVHDAGHLLLGEADVPVPGLLLHAQPHVTPLQREEGDVDIDEAGVYHGAPVEAAHLIEGPGVDEGLEVSVGDVLPLSPFTPELVSCFSNASASQRLGRALGGEAGQHEAGGQGGRVLVLGEDLDQGEPTPGPQEPGDMGKYSSKCS